VRVYVDMVADLLHRGHVEFLRKARVIAYSDDSSPWLIVGLHSDETTAGYKRKPILALEDRALVVSALRDVDQVVLDAPLVITAEFLGEYCIGRVVHGDDMTDTLSIAYAVPISMGIFTTVPYYKGVSTTEIIRRVAYESD